MTGMCADDPLAEYECYDIRGWDGFDAEPILPETVAAARQFMDLIHPDKMPDIAPGADGTIGFEWHFESGAMRKLFAEIWPDRVRCYSVMSRGKP